MKRIFISLPMDGLSEKEILDNIGRAKKRISRTILKHRELIGEDERIEFIDSYITENAPPMVNGGVWYLAKSIEKLAKADIVYFVSNALSSRGCKLEHEIAKQYGLPCVIEYSVIGGIAKTKLV